MILAVSKFLNKHTKWKRNRAHVLLFTHQKKPIGCFVSICAVTCKNQWNMESYTLHRFIEQVTDMNAHAQAHCIWLTSHNAITKFSIQCMQFESLGLCETLLYAPKSVQTFIEQVMTTAEYVLRSISERLELFTLPNRISWIFFSNFQWIF